MTKLTLVLLTLLAPLAVLAQETANPAIVHTGTQSGAGGAALDTGAPSGSAATGGTEGSAEVSTATFTRTEEITGESATATATVTGTVTLTGTVTESAEQTVVTEEVVSTSYMVSTRDASVITSNGSPFSTIPGTTLTEAEEFTKQVVKTEAASTAFAVPGAQVDAGIVAGLFGGVAMYLAAF